MAGRLVVIPYAPRSLQRVLHQGLDAHRWAVAVCHRRFGKSVWGVNHLQRATLRCTLPSPRFAYLAPTYTQGKSIAWDYMKRYANPIPGHTVNESELRIDYPNGGRLRIYGADNPDSLRGVYLDGVVFDEYGLQPPTIWQEVIRPLLTDRGGWAAFIGTPNGKNQFYDIVQRAKSDPEWFYAEYKASETGLVPQAELEDARSQMTADQYAQEFECSFDASVKGAVYAREMQAIREDGRLTRVPYDPALRVDTDWDLGMGDATAIVFSQSLRSREVRVIDYYENTGFGLPHYLQVLNQKPYTYGQHWAPHDIQVRELGTGHSRLEAARTIGLHFAICPKVEKVEDKIHAARMLLPRCYFDESKTGSLVEALKNYRWDYNSRIEGFTHLPVHNWASHGADAFAGLSYRHYLNVRSPEREAAAAVRAAQKDEKEPWKWARKQQSGRGGY